MKFKCALTETAPEALWQALRGKQFNARLVNEVIGGELNWTDTIFRNWRRRIFNPTAEWAGAPDLTPYGLRHSFASLMHQAHKPPVWVAAQMGHSLRVHLDHYVHIMEDVDPDQKIDPEAMIFAAREKVEALSGHDRPPQ